jgi:hypothetical protein
MTADRPNRRVKRRIAATAATAAIALGGPAAAERPAKARAAPPPRGAVPQVSRLAGTDRESAAAALEVSRRDELEGHRHRLAGALAAETGDADTATLEIALAEAHEELSAAYSRGERPSLSGGFHADLAARSGISEDELEAAFEAMARRALDRRRDSSA